jgi:hypothetical protein
MMSRRRASLLLGLACLIALVIPWYLSTSGAPTPSPTPLEATRPRLVVLVYFDQLRGDYLSRWQDLFGEGGFRRLQTDGAWFTNCHYPYAGTVTGAGHASVATGCCPAEHGIIGNEWTDRVTGEMVGCANVGRYQRVPASDRPPPMLSELVKKEKPNVSPERLRAPTIGDALKAATGDQGRVVSLSLKERSAVLPAGQHSDACYWLDLIDGQFVTSTYYRYRPHPWVADFNRGRPADAWFNRTWERFRPDLDYVHYSGPDDMAGEGKGANQGRTFPHPMNGGQKKPDALTHAALFNSPFGNDLLLDLALRAIDAEHLGRGTTPDLLCLSFSSNDAVGHTWGPDSQEVLDVTLRSDVIVRRLLDHLDAQVGRGRYVLAVTADHGVCPLPEVARMQGKESGRVPPELLKVKAEAFLTATFGPKPGRSRWLLGNSDMWAYFNQKLLHERGLKPAVVEEALASWLKQQTGIETAYTRTQLLQGLSPNDEIGQAVERSFFPETSGDVAFVLRPYFIMSPVLNTGTTHGTPHPYDTHVPLLVFGPGIQKGVRDDPVTPLVTPVILARALGIAPPAAARAPVPEGLFTAP